MRLTRTVLLAAVLAVAALVWGASALQPKLPPQLDELLRESAGIVSDTTQCVVLINVCTDRYKKYHSNEFTWLECLETSGARKVCGVDRIFYQETVNRMIQDGLAGPDRKVEPYDPPSQDKADIPTTPEQTPVEVPEDVEVVVPQGPPKHRDRPPRTRPKPHQRKRNQRPPSVKDEL